MAVFYIQSDHLFEPIIGTTLCTKFAAMVIAYAEYLGHKNVIKVESWDRHKPLNTGAILDFVRKLGHPNARLLNLDS